MFYTITLNHVLMLTSLLLVVGLVGMVLNRKNIILVLMCLEMMLLSVTLTLVGAGHFRGDLGGQVLSFFILAVAAAELAIGLAIVTLFFRNTGGVEIDRADRVRG